MLQFMKQKEFRKVPKLKNIFHAAITRQQKEQSEKRRLKADPSYELNFLRGSSNYARKCRQLSRPTCTGD